MPNFDAEDSNDQNTNWFRRHVLEKLTDLAAGQAEILASQRLAQDANVKHAAEDAAAFAEIRQEIESLKLVKLLVYGFVGMVLAVVIRTFPKCIFCADVQEIAAAERNHCNLFPIHAAEIAYGPAIP